jgi:hypothetical protein
MVSALGSDTRMSGVAPASSNFKCRTWMLLAYGWIDLSRNEFPTTHHALRFIEKISLTLHWLQWFGAAGKTSAHYPRPFLLAHTHYDIVHSRY